MLIVYAGNGKGKTSACVGQAIRAHAHQIHVSFAQFMKSDKQTGEQIFLQNLLQDDFFIGGKGFFTSEEQRPEHRIAAKNVLAFAHKQIAQKTQMLILDESLYALKKELILQAELEELISICKAKEVHLVLSGRGLPEWLTALADIVSEIADIKHACKLGVAPTKGIEF